MEACVPPGHIPDLSVPLPRCFSHSSLCPVPGLGFNLLLAQDPHAGDSSGPFTWTLTPLSYCSTQPLAFMTLAAHALLLLTTTLPQLRTRTPTPPLRTLRSLTFPEVQLERNKTATFLFTTSGLSSISVAQHGKSWSVCLQLWVSFVCPKWKAQQKIPQEHLTPF